MLGQGELYKLLGLIKDKVAKREAVNVGKLRQQMLQTS
jgi:hypothetical protein